MRSANFQTTCRAICVRSSVERLLLGRSGTRTDLRQVDRLPVRSLIFYVLEGGRQAFQVCVTAFVRPNVTRTAVDRTSAFLAAGFFDRPSFGRKWIEEEVRRCKAFLKQRVLT